MSYGDLKSKFSKGYILKSSDCIPKPNYTVVLELTINTSTSCVCYSEVQSYVPLIVVGSLYIYL